MTGLFSERRHDILTICSPPLDAITVGAWTTMPKNASCHRSPRSAISARASTTWLPAAQSKHSSRRRVLRESRLHPKETKRSTVTRRRLARALIKREVGKLGEAQRLIKLLWWREGKYRYLPAPSRLLLELPQVKTFCSWRILIFFLFVIWCNTQEYCCIIALKDAF